MAGLGRRVFAAGEVLTAGNVMGYLQDQAVMNFAGTAARGSAIGTAVSEGMVSYLADSNVVQAYDGSAWNSLAYASAVPTFSQVGLIPVAPTSVDKTGGTATANALGQVTFTGVSSLSLNGVFTSEYRNYKIIFDEISAGDTSVSFRVRKAGTDATSGQYVANISYVTQTGTAQAFQSYASSSGFGVTSTTRHISAVMEIIKPQVTGYTKIFASSNHVSSAFDFRSTSTLGLFHAVSDSYDGITFYPDTSNFTGTISVYGYND